MKTKQNLILALLGMMAPVVATAANIDVIGDTTGAYSTNSFASTNGGVDGGLGTNIRVIGSNTTWTKNNTYFVTDRLFIPRGVTLTIEPGTKIYSSINDNGTPTDKTDDKVGSIVATRGGKLIADGTAAEPIVFTSVREWEAANGVDSAYDADTNVGPAPTAADGGQWGGIIMLGQAYCSFVNASGVNAGTVQIEGFAPAGSSSYDGDTVPDATQYGVSAGFARNDADNSGTIRYCSIRHGGYEFAAGKEINGLTLGAVGSGTTIEYLEVYANQDDGIEFFGGRVSANHLVMAFNQDDSFDIDEGYAATNQFWLSIQNPGDTDAGGEWDGVGGTSGGYGTVNTGADQHHAKPIIYNATMIGAGSTNTLSVIPNRTGQVHTEKGNFALHIEDRFNGELYNSVLHDYAQGLFKFNDTISTGATPKFRNNTIGSMGGGTTGDNLSYIFGNGKADTLVQDFAFDAFGFPLNGNSDVNTNPMFSTYMRNGSNFITAFNPAPAKGSPLLISGVSAGAPVPVNYRGAFGPGDNWAAGWTKLSQSGVLTTGTNIDVIGDTTGTFSANSFASTNGGVDGGLGTNIRVIGSNTTWTKNNTYFVTDRLFIPRGKTLTIEPGTKVYFSINDNGTSTDKTDDKVGSIVATRGGKLIADGTAAEPIVFTSVREWEAENNVDSPYDADTNVGPAPTAADAGQWGGLIMLGQAYCSFVNASGVNAGTVQIEGFAPAGSSSYDGDTIPDATQYGVSTGFSRNDTDNSGTIRYCSIRHGGYEFASGKEINGLTLGAVGSGTTIEYLEVYANQDDGIEFFGGRVSANHLVMAFNQDDSFDIDEGYAATNQFWLSIQNPGDTDAGGEWDGVGGTSGGYGTVSTGADQHHAKPIIYNATMIGAGSTNTLSVIPNRTGQVHTEKGNFALHIEDRFNGEVYNSVVHDYAQGLIKFNDAISTGATPKFRNNTIGNMGGGTPGNNNSYISGTGATDTLVQGFVFDALGDPVNGNSNVNTNPMFTAYTRNGSNFITAFNPVPATGSPLLISSLATGAPKTAYYRGAFGPEGNWAAGWTKLSQSGVLTGAAPISGNGVLDTDGDGISDELESSPALTALGFNSTVNNVTGTNLFSSLYTATSIQSLRGTGLMIQASGTGPVTLTLPLFKSTDLINWTPAGNATATTPFVSGKQFYRVDLSSGAANQ